MTVSAVTAVEITIELDPADFSCTTDSGLIERATMHVYDFAASVGAVVDVEVITVSYRHHSIRLGVSGHHTEVSAFSRAWNEE